MVATSCGRPYWGVILAGGEGERLRRLTRFIAGDDRPKQFCPLLEGGQTLLARTRARIVRAIDPAQTLFVLTESHEPFYSVELAEVPEERMIIQPFNRGTAAAVVCGLARIAQKDPHAIVAFLPSDHYYSVEQKFVQGLISAFEAAAAAPHTVILLGAKAKYAETGYGYIEPGHRISTTDARLRQTDRFWEKPTPAIAQALKTRGCLWNTFVMVGTVKAFLELIEGTAPELYESFAPALDQQSQIDLGEIYTRLGSCDFSRQILSMSASRTAVLGLGDIGWSDLGEPQRVMATLSEQGIQSPWRQPWLKQKEAAAAAG